MDVFLAAFPILMVVVAMLAFGLPAKTALPLGWLATFAVAVGYWRQDLLTSCAWALDGFLESASVLAVVFGAILVMNTLKHSGALAAGNMICVNNVVAVCATTGVSGCEGRIIRINLIPCFVYCLVAIVVLGLVA